MKCKARATCELKNACKGDHEYCVLKPPFEPQDDKRTAQLPDGWWQTRHSAEMSSIGFKQ